jgi:hypothetical protein
MCDGADATGDGADVSRGFNDGEDSPVEPVSGLSLESAGDTSDEEMMGSSPGVSKGVSLTEPCYAMEFKVDLKPNEMFINA